MTQKDNIIIKILKLFSGRVLLTIICGIVFIMFSHTICKIILSKSNEITFDNLSGIINMLLLIVSNVITFYFSKDSSNKDDKSKKNQEDEWQVNIKKTK